jgi:Ca2+-binding RTX toxin-like protein
MARFPSARFIAVGALFACLAVLPGSAVAKITGRYYVNEDTNLRTLETRSDDAPDTIVPGCSGGHFTVNGVVKTIGGLFIACGGDSGPQDLVVYGGGGNDTINLTNVTRASFGSIVHDTSAGAPTDSVDADGGPGQDTMIGGPLGERFNDDATDSEVGADTVRGNGGDDDVRGTTGNDKLFGGAGNDVIGADSGRDVAYGGPGKDSIHAFELDKGPDRFYGESGRDQLIGGAGNDRLDGGPGNDFIDGGPGKDKLFGRTGADGIFGHSGADTIFGNAGNDYIRGGKGKDKIHPGSGKNNVKQ